MKRKNNKIWIWIFAAFVFFGIINTSFEPENTSPRNTAIPTLTPYISVTLEPTYTPESINTIIPVITYTITTPKPTEEPTSTPITKLTEESDWKYEEREEKNDIVYITKTGAKYHSNKDCGFNKYTKEVAKEEAIKQGYEPCKKCY